MWMLTLYKNTLESVNKSLGLHSYDISVFVHRIG